MLDQETDNKSPSENRNEEESPHIDTFRRKLTSVSGKVRDKQIEDSDRAFGFSDIAARAHHEEPVLLLGRREVGQWAGFHRRKRTNEQQVEELIGETRPRAAISGNQAENGCQEPSTDPPSHKSEITRPSKTFQPPTKGLGQEKSGNDRNLTWIETRSLKKASAPTTRPPW